MIHFCSKIQELITFYIAGKDTNKKTIFGSSHASTHAVQVESTENLATNDCITAMRRFIASRGTPKLLISDNAT